MWEPSCIIRMTPSSMQELFWGWGGIAGHVMCRASREDAGYFGRMVSVQEISAVTAACMLVDACDFRAVGGFDESFRVAFNDIDLCMKIRDIGRKNRLYPLCGAVSL